MLSQRLLLPGGVVVLKLLLFILRFVLSEMTIPLVGCRCLLLVLPVGFHCSLPIPLAKMTRKDCSDFVPFRII
jgi:hypothetical protein